MAGIAIPSLHIVLNDHHNPLVSEEQILLEQIISTHVHTDTKFDVDSLFTLVEKILKRSTHIVDNLVQGTHGSPEHIDDKNPQARLSALTKQKKASFSSPLCILKRISSEMSCKDPGEEIAHKTTLAILNDLSSYSWDAKAVLTLAAFAIEYGEFWLLYQSTDPLARSLATIKRVSVLSKPSALQKHRQAILELNNLIKTTLQVIELIFKLENLASYDTKDMPALAPALEQIPVDVYWAIITIVAVVTQIDCLTTDSEQTQELSQFGQKINNILRKLRKQISECQKQKEEAEYLRMLWRIFHTPTEITEALKLLIFGKDTPMAPIYDRATKKLVSIEVLKKKDVFLFISTLEITQEEISLLKPIYDDITKKENNYKIVWVPIVEEWNDQLCKKFELLKSKMPWYVLQHFAPIKGFKFIKEEWQFKKKPTVVVLNPQAKIQHSNAFHMIQVWGLTGFPFTLSKEKKLITEPSWFQHLWININSQSQIRTWMEKQHDIFFYGGKSKEWIQEFKEFAGNLANDATIQKAKIPIELLCIESELQNATSRFWSAIESLFVMTKMHIETSNTVTQEVQKMLSYKNESGWALLSKGSTVVLTGHGTTILETVKEFDKWKHLVIENFAFTFQEQHDQKVAHTSPCTHLEIPNVAGKIPDTIECPECHRTMEMFFGYKCCHTESTTANAEP